MRKRVRTIFRIRIRWRRWQHLDAYSQVFTVRTGKRGGSTPLMAAIDAAADDSLLELDDSRVVWHRPEDASDVGATD